MLTKKALNKILNEVIVDFLNMGFDPYKIILFGSYVNGGLHANSDVDLAVWSKKFIGEGMIDFEIVRPIIKKYRGLDIKMYPLNATSDNFDPFIGVIEESGIEVYNKSNSKIVENVADLILSKRQYH